MVVVLVVTMVTGCWILEVASRCVVVSQVLFPVLYRLVWSCPETSLVVGYSHFVDPVRSEGNSFS